MARPAGLIGWLLPALVLLAHLAAVEWLARQREARSLPPALPPVMYTRFLQPVAPVPTVAAAAAPAARKPRSKAPALAPAVAVRPVEVAAIEPPAPPPEVKEPEVVVPPAEAEEVLVAAPEPGDPLASWPADTRLRYRLEGSYRGGPVYGEARVQWQREGARYQVALQLDVRFFGGVRMTSHGDVTPQGLLPRAFEEVRPGWRRVARFGEETVVLERGRRAARPPGLQDTVSQFVELAHRFASGRDLLAVGSSVSFPMARPDGVDHWTYDVVASELLPTPELGEVEAFHLKPRPIANPRGEITAEMWFAPSLQYLPVRVQVLLGDGAFIDLVVQTIEQR